MIEYEGSREKDGMLKWILDRVDKSPVSEVTSESGLEENLVSIS